MTKEALKLALEALEKGVCVDPEDSHRAIYAIREALAQQPAQKRPQNCGTGYCSCIECVMEPQQEPVACVQDLDEVKRKHLVYEKGMDWKDPLYTTPPSRKPLTHEQRVDLLAKFEDHKHEWHAPAILIDMVEAAHGITGEMK